MQTEQTDYEREQAGRLLWLEYYNRAKRARRSAARQRPKPKPTNGRTDS
jgi:hypothetical protein